MHNVATSPIIDRLRGAAAQRVIGEGGTDRGAAEGRQAVPRIPGIGRGARGIGLGKPIAVSVECVRWRVLVPSSAFSSPIHTMHIGKQRPPSNSWCRCCLLSPYIKRIDGFLPGLVGELSVDYLAATQQPTFKDEGGLIGRCCVTAPNHDLKPLIGCLDR